jgi:hypothetical protein
MHTFLPSGITERSTSILAMAKTSADADMLTRKSVGAIQISIMLQLTSSIVPTSIESCPISPGSFHSIWYVPCTVAFAPIAVSAPIVPTMKYWNTKLLLLPCLLL